ncbi:MAG: hypothetical protein CL609_14840 [Anaerolineaceae bacterium]|nr:hypothetical protein [Anaerolineaceae bacterium]
MDLSKMPAFIPGLTLSQTFYEEVVKPILVLYFPNLSYSAALIGFGSDVIGYDTPMSRDHMWGPRLILFLPEKNFLEEKESINQCLRDHLPYTYKGYPTNFGSPDNIGVRLFQEINSGPVEHLIEITTIAGYFDQQLGQDRWRNPNHLDWLTFSEHVLLSLTSGAVFYDQLGLETIRKNLSYYPNDVWLYQMASAWSYIGQEEHFVGRTGSVGDDIGSRIITTRLIHVCMRLAFLQEKQFAPYSKWFGSAFQKLNNAKELTPLINKTLNAVDWQTRENNLCAVYEILAQNHNQLDLTKPIKTSCQFFHDRPFRVMGGDQIAQLIQSVIKDSSLRSTGLFGSVNQLSSTCDFLENTDALIQAKSIYKR